MKKNSAVRIIFWCIGFLTIFQASYAQEYQGLSADPTSGWYSVHINPATSAFYPYSYQVNIMGAHLFFETDYARISNTSLIKLIRNINDVDIATHPSQINDAESVCQLIFDENGGKKMGAIAGSILWPAYLWTKDKKTKYGIYAKSRITGSFYKLPEDLGYYEAAAVREPTDISPFSTSYHSWTDLGFHWSKVVIQDNYETSSVGVNARLVIPHESARFELLDDLQFNRMNNLYTGQNLTSSSQYTYFENGGFRPRMTGLGMAMDIGYTTATDQESYGFSVLDLGVAYTSGEAEAFDIFSDTTIIYDNAGLTDPGDLNEVLTDLDDQLDPQISRLVEESNSYVLGLPTAISFQYHRKLSASWSLSSVLVQRVPFFPKSVRRPNTFSVMIRHRKGALNLAVPVSIFEYRKVGVGIALNYSVFSMGTDNIFSFLPQSRFSGSDLFFGLRFYPFKENKREESVRCFSF